tara:strand:- start:9044 stop:10066 length:1023 start_codon:yes stop_codon:yes gene_type:complete
MKGCMRILFLTSVIIFLCCCSNNTTYVNEGRFVFLSNRDSPKGEFDIFIYDLNDSSQINLTSDLEFIRSISKPSLSFDKNLLLYTSFSKGSKILRIIDIKNKKSVNLSNVDLDNPSASFFNSDKKVLFTKKIGGKKQLFKIDVNGENEENVSSSNSNEYKGKISPNEKLLLFLRGDKDETFIVIRDVVSANETVIKVNGNKINPAFTNDDRIVYESFVDGSYKIFVYDITTKKSNQLTTGNANAHHPIFVKEGKSVLFISDGRGKKYRDLAMLNLNNSNYMFLTSGLNMINQNFSLSRDKKNILFESSKFNDSEIYLLKLEDKSFINLTKNIAWDCQPSF